MKGLNVPRLINSFSTWWIVMSAMYSYVSLVEDICFNINVSLVDIYLNPPRVWNLGPPKPTKNRPFWAEIWHPNGGSRYILYASASHKYPQIFRGTLLRHRSLLPCLWRSGAPAKSLDVSHTYRCTKKSRRISTGQWTSGCPKWGHSRICG